jgi:hypothetical protein
VLSQRLLINLVLIALIAGLSYAGFHFEPGSSADPKSTISALRPDDVHSIEIQTADLQLRLQRSAQGWDLETPINWPAYATNVGRLLSILNFETSPLADAADIDLAQLGLQPPKANIRFNDSLLQFGTTNNIGERRYVMLDTRVYLLPDVHLAFISQGLSALVDRRLLPRGAEILSLHLPDLEISLAQDKLWHSNQAPDFSQSSLQQLVENWQSLQATRISQFDPGLVPGQPIEIKMADGRVIDFLLLSEIPEIVIAHPDIGLQYYFRSDFRDQLIALRSDETDS